ncbi:MAG: hypothetical protein QF437_23910 [Planctomycetota bacterium]|jgi:hypothetical protein|nr:hypothetical protein [Planctomycetota bacterium]MDP7133562.1 hypothetical protein [Planctomycetota bacterium]
MNTFLKRNLTRFLALVAVVSLVVGASIFVLTKSWQRWDINDEWAQKIVADAEELRIALADYKDANGAEAKYLIPRIKEVLGNRADEIIKAIEASETPRKMIRLEDAKQAGLKDRDRIQD